MSVESTKHKSAMEARDHFFEKLEEATLTGRWMAVVWKIEDGKIRVGSCTKHNFPDDDFPKALDLLKEHSPLGELPDTPLHSADDSPVIRPFPEVPTPVKAGRYEEMTEGDVSLNQGAWNPQGQDAPSGNQVVNEIPLPQGPPKPNPGETQS